MNNKLFYRLKAGSEEKQVICFPYLGGYANSFLDLSNALGEDVELWALNPPGHGGCAMQPLEDIEVLLDLYEKEIQEILRPNCVFFGHSMGGIMAYFLTQHLLQSQNSLAESITLVLSSCNTPSDFQGKNYSNLSNDNLIDHLISYDGIPEELINEKNLLEFFLPIFRADFKVLETSATHDYTPLNIPVYVLWGESDKIVPIESIAQWSKYFRNEVNLIPIENGSHMFIYDKANVVAKHLEDIIFQSLV